MSLAAPSNATSGIARIAARFAANAAAGRKAVAPFVTAGDPDTATTADVLAAIDRAGATLIELGVPYSDPIADGAVIQASYVRALAQGMSLDRLFAMVKDVTGRITTPVLAMVSYSIIYRRGIDRFVAESLAAGLAGFVVPDLPIEESDDLAAACEAAGLALVRLVTPTTPPERARGTGGMAADEGERTDPRRVRHLDSRAGKGRGSGGGRGDRGVGTRAAAG
jgi:tryptophan synthase alpha chain